MIRPLISPKTRKKAVWGRSAVLALCAALLAVPASAQTSTADSGKLDEAVQAAVNTGQSARIIMQFTTTEARDAAFTRLLNRGAAVRSMDTEGGPALNVLSSAATFVPEVDSAVRVSIDATVSTSSTQRRAVRDHIVRSAVRSGRQARAWAPDLSVAVIDSGLMAQADLPSWRVLKYKDFVTGGTTPVDQCGHGTHVAGIVGGNGFASNGAYAGVDPSVGIVALRVLGDDCSGRTSDVLDALEWVARNHSLYRIKVVNLSIGHPVFESAATDPMVQAVERLSRKGIVVVTAAGNMGINPMTHLPGYGGVSVPCNAPSSLCVGALDTKGTQEFGDDSVAGFSARGPSRFDLLAKPDMVADGVRVISLSAPGSKLYNAFPGRRVRGTKDLGDIDSYLSLTGTSMASPRVAGAAALVLTANRDLSANMVKMVLQYTARVLPVADALTQGAGALNIQGAVTLARMVNPAAPQGSYWLTTALPTSNLDQYGQDVAWGRRLIWGDRFMPAAAISVHMARWDDNIVWGFDALVDNIVWGNATSDNIVWGNAVLNGDNIVWGNAFDDNIVWGVNIVWGENIVWGYWSDNIVWGFVDDNIVWGNVTRANLDNIVWGYAWDNIVWGNCANATALTDNIVWGNAAADNIVWGFCSNGGL